MTLVLCGIGCGSPSEEFEKKNPILIYSGEATNFRPEKIRVVRGFLYVGESFEINGVRITTANPDSTRGGVCNFLTREVGSSRRIVVFVEIPWTYATSIYSEGKLIWSCHN